MRNTLIPILVAICLFITGVAILNIQLWYSAKAEYLAGARYAANNINHILEEASQATQTAVNIAGKECDLEEQYQLGTEAALKPHLRTIIILKQGIVWCTSLPGNRVLLSRIPVVPDSNLLLAPAIDCQRQDYWPFFAIFNVRYWSLMLSAFRHFIITDWRGV
ncbi:CSS-motif domain-containing protein, partial [Escherichia coli]